VPRLLLPEDFVAMQFTQWMARLTQARAFSLGPVVTASYLIASLANAQALPDAGAVRQQIEQGRRESLPERSPPQLVAPTPLQSIGGATVSVTSFRFEGNTLLSHDELIPVVEPFLGRALDFAGLQNAAIAVANVYRDKGWVVRAYLPQQDVTIGVITIQIIEARFGAVHMEGEATRISGKRLQRVVEAAQKAGDRVSVDALDRGLLLVNDLPGVSATARLAPGANDAQTDLVVAANDGALVNGAVTADNAGSRFTGSQRVIANASLNDRIGFGDRTDALLLHSRGSDYASLGFSLPIGSGGWRAGINGSHLSYDIITKEFAALDAHGISNSVGLQGSYPLLRTRMKNLYLSLAADEGQFNNQSAGMTVTDYSVMSATVGLRGNTFDNFFGGGVNTASLSIRQGKVDLSGSPNETADSLTTRTNGSYRKFALAISRLQALNDRFSLFGSLQMQMASKNLDSSEKLYLGGSQAVRAYPADEAGGSQGWLLDIESRAKILPSLSATAFVDWGHVTVNKENDIAGAASPNDITLKGAGISANWVAPFGLSVSATYTRRIGSNPNATSDGADQDGTLKKNRFWLQASMPF
jgi:hemolysin activation/secretion protein